jgi:large-conductance mechanosensitive channel
MEVLSMIWSTPVGAIITFVILGFVVFGLVRWANKEPAQIREQTSGQKPTEVGR